MKKHVVLLILALFLFAQACKKDSNENFELSGPPYLVLESNDWFWSSQGCEANHFTFDFSDNLERLTLNYLHPVEAANNTELTDTFAYDVLDIHDHTIQLMMDGEYRVDSEGSLIGWDIILTSNNSFLWQISGTQTQYGPITTCE